MELQLIQGSFSAEDAISLLTRIIGEKIRFHESKIEKSHSEEDIHMRERRIHELQNDLHNLRRYLQQKGGNASVKARIEID